MAKKRIEVLAVVGMVALLQGCGGSDDKGGASAGGSGTFSCDIPGPPHGCVETGWSGGPYPTTALASACSQGGGVPGTGCTRSGSAGGCRTTQTNGAFTLTSTNWYYAPTTVAEGQAACTPVAGSVYVAP